MRISVLDLDGTLADDRHRVHHALDKRWTEYFTPENMLADSVHPEGRAIVNMAVTMGFQIVYLTGRRSDTREVTEEWLDMHGFPPGRLIMRPYPDPAPRPVLAEFKLAKMRALLAIPHVEDVVLFDDDPEVVRVIHENLGQIHAELCTWQPKEAALVKLASI